MAGANMMALNVQNHDQAILKKLPSIIHKAAVNVTSTYAIKININIVVGINVVVGFIAPILLQKLGS